MEPPHRRVNCAPRLLELPTELQLVCLGFAPDAATLASCLASCSALRSLQESAFEVFCHRNWLVIASVAANALEGAPPPDAYWQTVAHTAKLLASASTATTPPARSFNQHVTAARREILIEWLIEVSEDWNLDGAEVFTAVRIMDAFLAAKPLTSLSILQLVGICCLRVAMQMGSGPGGCASQQRWQQPGHPDPKPSSGVSTGPEADLMAGTGAGATAAPAVPVDPYSASASAFVCAGIYSVKDIEEMTAIVSEFVRSQQEERSVPLISAPTARHFLRVLWLAAVEASATADADRGSTAAAAAPSLAKAATVAAVVPPPSRGAVLHLAGFLLHLSLLDPACCAAPPSHAAAAAISLALEVLGLSPWPPALRRALPLREVEDVAPLRQRIAAMQAQHDVAHLREVWMWGLAMRHWRMEPVELPAGRCWVGVDGTDGAGPGLGAPVAAAEGSRTSHAAEGDGANGSGGDGANGSGGDGANGSGGDGANGSGGDGANGSGGDGANGSGGDGANGSGGDGAGASGSRNGHEDSGAGSSSSGGGGSGGSVLGGTDVDDAAVKAMRLRVETVIRHKGLLPLC